MDAGYSGTAYGNGRFVGLAAVSGSTPRTMVSVEGENWIDYNDSILVNYFGFDLLMGCLLQEV